MISGPIALAFTAGMVATFNPCGFSLLPAYIGAFVAGDQVHDRLDQRILRAVGVAAAVSVGFIVVFASVGLIIDSIAGEARRQLPWVTIVIGGLLVVAGLAMAVGWKPTLAIRGPRFSTGANSPKVMVGYGITYAVASLSCTIGPFLAVTGTALSQSTAEGLATYIAYALGMGIIILVLSVASALAHSTVANHMRRLSRIAPRVGGILMVAAGAYAIWYGRWELAVYDGNLDTDPVIETAEDIRLWFVETIQSVGSQRLALLAALAIATVVALTRLRSQTTAAAPPAASTDPDVGATRSRT
ncbi:MAG: cytochrome c biogenesis CcdA family protein [Acidimicrobiales bacterium]|nr:cytochrome c biogenesis CcdA family protein [Acidimicrobiales bacterium]